MDNPDKLPEADALRLLLMLARLEPLRAQVRAKEAELSALAAKLGVRDGDTVAEDGTITRAPKP